MTVIHIVGHMRGKHPDYLLALRLSMHKILCSLCGTWLQKRLRALKEPLLLADNKLNFNLRPRGLVLHLRAQIVIYSIAPRDFFDYRTALIFIQLLFSFYTYSFLIHTCFLHDKHTPSVTCISIWLSRLHMPIFHSVSLCPGFAVLYLISFSCLKLCPPFLVFSFRNSLSFRNRLGSSCVVPWRIRQSVWILYRVYSCIILALWLVIWPLSLATPSIAWFSHLTDAHKDSLKSPICSLLPN